jgi:hypothetical protein
MNPSTVKHNLRYKEVDSFLQEQELLSKKIIATVRSTSMKDNKQSKHIKNIEQEHTYQELQQEQMELHIQLEQRKRSTSSTSTSSNGSRQSSPMPSRHGSKQSSPLLSPEHQCPFCLKQSAIETIRTWKECGHTKILLDTIPTLVLEPPALPTTVRDKKIELWLSPP